MSARTTYHWGIVAWTAIAFELMLTAAAVGAWWFIDHWVPSFHLARTDLLPVLLAGPAALLLFILNTAWRDRALRRFAQSGTLSRMMPGVSAARNLGRYLLMRIGVGLAGIALLAPQLGSRPETVRSKGIDLILCVDVSNSMECEDLRPSRMMATRRAMLQMIDRLKGDRLGRVVFAGEAYMQLPLTTDRSAAKLFIRTIGTQSVSTQGTAIGAAIDLARQAFQAESPAGKAIIVISDGENHEDDAVSAAEQAAAEGIVVHTIGIGTANGAPIPIRKNGQAQGFRKDQQGRTVVTRLNEALLRRIASAGNGSYVLASNSNMGIVELVEQLKQMEQAELGSVRYTAYDDQYQWPLGAALACFALYLLLGERRNPRAVWRASAA
ncbi:MAG TPA: VWA domain-containing protein [Flavobacteriales bacterium]|nr:VWA domain-containing protein [Flavobacteriales bacterium]